MNIHPAVFVDTNKKATVFLNTDELKAGNVYECVSSTRQHAIIQKGDLVVVFPSNVVNGLLKLNLRNMQIADGYPCEQQYIIREDVKYVKLAIPFEAQ